MKQPYDSRTQLEYIVWHNDDRLESFIKHLIKTVKPDRWVETGTHMGWTSAWVAENYPGLPLYTIEVDKEFHSLSKQNLEKYPRVYPSFGNSPEFLRKLHPILNRGVSIFWLDAHWWPPVPLLEECKIITSLDRYICLIDDFSCWSPYFEGDIFWSRAPCNGPARYNDLSYLHEIMGKECYRPDYQSVKGNKGYALFTKGVDYIPPSYIMKKETMPVEEIYQLGIDLLRKNGQET